MALSKIQAESMNLADTFAFSGTVSGAGGMELLQTQTASSDVANITFTSTVLTSTYSTYFVTGKIIGSGNFNLFPSIDNGSNYNLSTASAGGGYYYNVSANNSGELTSNFRAGGSGVGIMIMADVQGGTASTQKGMVLFSGYVVNSTDYSASRTSSYFGVSNRSYASGNNYHTMPSNSGGTTFTNASAWNNLKFQWSSGNIIANSKISLYGIK